MDLAVDVRDLTFAYRQSAPILDVPRLTVARGARVFLHGPSGSGKTTLLGILAGILQADSGQVRILGEDFAQLRGKHRDRFRGASLGYIFQMFNLIPYLDVLGNILLPCHLSPVRRQRAAPTKANTTDALEAAARALAERLDIAHLLAKPVTELSVGQQQRVAAARALIGAPPLIIADEPTSALDSDHREAFLRLLFDEAARAGAAVLFVSHDLGLAPLFTETLSLRQLNRVPAGGRL